MKWSKIIIVAGFTLACSSPTICQAQSAPIIEVIKEGIKKVIKAVDLKIQRIQTKTIWLQNAQKVLENTMSKLKLNEISDWVQKQKDLYASYFDELWKVKEAITTYHRVKEIINLQLEIVNEYKSAYNLFKQDSHFTPNEIVYMGEVYTGILDESLKNLDQLFMVVNAFATQMTDQKRMEIISKAETAMQQNWSDLHKFNNQNKMLSLARASEQGDVDVVRKLYGLQ